MSEETKSGAGRRGNGCLSYDININEGENTITVAIGCGDEIVTIEVKSRAITEKLRKVIRTACDHWGALRPLSPTSSMRRAW